jgi:hypothetical protein
MKSYYHFKPGETVYLKEPYYIDLSDGLFAGYVYGSTISEEAKKYCKRNNKLFMPEKYARHHIEITGVKAERLQDISDEDCMDNGVYLDIVEADYFHYYDYEDRHYCTDCEEAARRRLIEEVLKDKTLLCFGNEDEDVDDEWIREELDGYSSYDDCTHAKTCEMCGKDLSVFRNAFGGKFYDIIDAYAALIDATHGKCTWESNPFVWVYDFKLTAK